MKIINLETFRAMPPGTVYSKFNPHVFEGLMIKGSTLEYDFGYQDLIGNIDADDSGMLGNMIFDAMEDSKISLPLDFDCCGRDGLFENDQLFAVYEKADVEGLIKRLQESVISCQINL